VSPSEQVNEPSPVSDGTVISLFPTRGVGSPLANAPPDYLFAGYTTYDAAAGLAKDAWSAEFFGQNLSDTRAQIFISSSSFQTLTATNRPRVLGVRFSYKFGGNAKQ
jgi:hypothetical protein